jgi:F-type H+-transporting ATPase subunit delta
VATAEGKVAKRYARALFELTAVPELDRTNDGLKGVAEAFLGTVELRHVLLNPAIPLPQRTAVAQDVARVAGGNVAVLENFVGVLLENSRIELLGEIAKEFSAIVAQVKKILALEVVSAFPLSSTEQQEIQQRMQRDFGSLAALSWSVDPAIVGGLVVKSGDLQLDGSVKGVLERAREALLGA